MGEYHKNILPQNQKKINTFENVWTIFIILHFDIVFEIKTFSHQILISTMHPDIFNVNSY